MRGLWLAGGHGTRLPFAGGLATSTENAQPRASSSRGRPVVIIPGGAATAVVLAGPLPPIERRASATGGSARLPVPAAARLALTRTAFLPAVGPAGMTTVLRGNCPASAHDRDTSSRLPMRSPSVPSRTLVTDITGFSQAGHDRIAELPATADGSAPHIAAALTWMALGACRGEDPELFFPIAAQGSTLSQISEARAVCRRCAVAAMCLAYALQTRQAGILREEPPRRNAAP